MRVKPDSISFSYMEKLCFLDRTASLQTQFIKQVPATPSPPLN